MTPGDLVEREREIAALAELLDAAPAGEGRVAWIEGPAGIGKSRLAHEFQLMAWERPSPEAVVRGRCLPYGDGLTYWPLAEMVKAAHNFQFSSTDPGAWAHNMDYMTQLLYDSIEKMDPASPALGVLSRGEP